ncbi:MAG: hypothetical protein SYC29_07185 [Planctomycetota bacterium]|nr:hypothetical protein [Planctomycetota bacterium]
MSQLPHDESYPSDEKTLTNPATALAGCDREVLDQLVAGALGPLSRLRDTIDLTLEEVSEWIVQPENRERISNLVTLLDAQTQLIICQQRLVAVARLVEVARSAPAYETVRRACADLLRIRLVDPYREDKRPIRMPPPRPVDEAVILAALEELGRADEPPKSLDPEEPPAPPVPPASPTGDQEAGKKGRAEEGDSSQVHYHQGFAIDRAATRPAARPQTKPSPARSARTN